MVVDSTADVDLTVAEVVSGAFDYQGQKCAAASRLYVAKSIWPELSDKIFRSVDSLSIGDVSDPDISLGAVINEGQFDKISEVISDASRKNDILYGGRFDKSEGFFIWPTIVKSDSLGSEYLVDEHFGPVLAVYVYEDSSLIDVVDDIDNNSSYALTGSFFSSDESLISDVLSRLRYSAGNVYVNSKPTGALVSERPFGGARASRTNDKTGTIMNILRFLSPRYISRRH